MLSGLLIVAISLLYLSVLFAVAWYGDRCSDRGRSLVASPYVYALSIGVYCTAWTFYGSVGLAARTGPGFLPIYLGPTLMFALGWVVVRKMIRISKVHHITSIADFVSSRYGKSHLLGGLVTIIAVVGIMPYITLQLKAVSTSFTDLLGYPHLPDLVVEPAMVGDTAFWIACLMATFAILFGTRHIDATERHEGMVAAIAFESVIKLTAFMAVGLFVTFGLFDGFGDLFDQAARMPHLARLMTLEYAEASWVPLTLLSMLTIILLPRQFQIIVVENVDEKHLSKAIWLLPLYLLLMNLFVLPIALGGLIRFDGMGVDADTFVLALPMAADQPALAVFAFLGGLSAATGMVIVATVALSTMICNDLIMPVLLRFAWFRLSERQDLSGLLLAIRRIEIIFVMVLGYAYHQLIGESYALVSIGLVSFAAAAQFAPAIFGGMYWKGGSKSGAMTGILAGFLVWGYTLLLPSFAKSGWLDETLITNGPFGIALLKPYALFGMTGLDTIPHALFWSLLANVGAYVAVSLLGRQSTIERIQATLFVEVFRQSGSSGGVTTWYGTVSASALRQMAERFLGTERTAALFSEYSRLRGRPLDPDSMADRQLVQFVERRLSGAIGAASARVMVASTVKGEGVDLDAIMQILDETSQVLEYSRQLEQKSDELERATSELKAANERLTDIDRLKDDFLSTVTHELRTPLTSIRSFSEILHDTPDLEASERQHFLSIIIRESERLTRLINQVLDLSKIETGRMDWQMAEVDMGDVVSHAVMSLRGLFEEKGVAIVVNVPDNLPVVVADRDQLIQLVINLLSNAEKFCPETTGLVQLDVTAGSNALTVSVTDNGPGIARDQQERIFEKFHQVRSGGTGNPLGSGLGLAICRGIVEHLGGRIWVQSEPGKGATFIFTVPCPQAAGRQG